MSCAEGHECGVGLQSPHHSGDLLCDPLLCPGVSRQCPKSVPGECLICCFMLEIYLDLTVVYVSISISTVECGFTPASE